MPTSGAVDLVARRLNLRLFETPTGSKYFGNVMDSKVPSHSFIHSFIYSMPLCAEMLIVETD